MTWRPTWARVPRSRDRIVAGVAGGWADRLRVEPTVLRAAIGLLTLVGGLGVVLYGAAALASADPLPLDTDATDAGRGPDRIVRREVAIGCGTAACLVAARAVGLWPGDAIMLAASAVAVGIAIAWSQSTVAQPVAGLHPWMKRAIQVTVGIALMIAGVLSLAGRTGGLASVGASASAIAVVVGGIAVFAAPAIGRLLRTLDDERAQKIREEERANLAAHLHDSVLQSLVLIQRTNDPRRKTQLARRQERELRSWLYGTAETGQPTTVHAAVEALAVEIEADHDVRVEAVVVGDQPLDEQARILLGALREAIVNCARHAGVERVDVFVEADSAELIGFVRDTGCGFDPATVPGDRRGISESIVGRVQRGGGVTSVTSHPGRGTEIEVRVPTSRR